MWFGTSKGLSEFSENQWRTYGVRDGLVSQDINCLLEDSGGVLWIGTAGGLAFLRNGRIQTPAGSQSWLTEPILGIAEDGSGSLWIATSARVLRAKRASLTNNQTLDDSAFRMYGRDNGLEGTEGVKRFRSLLGDSSRLSPDSPVIFPREFLQLPFFATNHPVAGVSNPIGPNRHKWEFRLFSGKRTGASPRALPRTPRI